ncbi:MAG: toxin-antitoxin system YwqK family antitoxin [Flavobacteriaceae bacterium]|nr:toxin-antitoxin system YwqK family antitoxin [Bacteroidia bacterium]NNK39972.1 toxin-antitoxin system YwqK family antitoxin [Winogradskyella sp.]NNL16546.1 toxin-antitoxin system YwqK family antitoxin [Flavobacteriaceae bacterium]
MKLILSVIVLFSSFNCLSQEVNKFDSKGLRHGIWKKNFKGTKSLRYEGQFNHGKEIGVFKFYKYLDEQSVLSATKKFNDSNDIAEVRFYSSKGKLISEGRMKGKIYIDSWKYYHKNSDSIMRLEEYDKKGLQQGELLVYFENGNLAEKTNYIDGKLEGESIWFNEQGIKIKEFLYKNNILDGLSKYYSNKGDLIIEGNYKNNKKHGIWKYYENGELKKTKDFTRKSKNPYIKKAP